MPGLDPPTDAEWQKINEESEKAFEMALAGAGMVLLSLLFGLINLITCGIVARKQRQREELIEHDSKISSEGGVESRRLVRETRGQLNRVEKILEVYRQHSTTKGKVWMQGFWAKIPNPIKRYIEEQYEQHPEWLDGAETGWWS